MVKTTKRDPERPKKYMSAFLLFLGDFRKKNSSRGYSTTDMTRKGAAVWRTFSNRDKIPYEEKSLKLKEKYTREFHKYQEKVKSRPKTESSAYLTKRTRKDPKRPKKALSAYMLFMQDFRTKNAERGWDVKVMVMNGAVAWKDLSKPEKHPYEKLAKKNGEKFRKRLASYKKKEEKIKMKQKAARTSSGSKSRGSSKSKQKNKTRTPSREMSTKRRAAKSRSTSAKGSKKAATPRRR